MAEIKNRVSRPGVLRRRLGGPLVHRDPEAQRHLVGPRKTSSSRGRQAFYVISEASYTRSTWCLHDLDDCNRVRGRVFRLRVLRELDQIDRAACKLQQPLQLRGLFEQAATTRWASCFEKMAVSETIEKLAEGSATSDENEKSGVVVRVVTR